MHIGEITVRGARRAHLPMHDFGGAFGLMWVWTTPTAWLASP